MPVRDPTSNTFTVKVDNARLVKTNQNGFASKYKSCAVTAFARWGYSIDFGGVIIIHVIQIALIVHFTKDAGINNFKCVGNKLFIVVTQVGNPTYSEEMGKGNVVVAVGE